MQTNICKYIHSHKYKLDRYNTTQHDPKLQEINFFYIVFKDLF